MDGGKTFKIISNTYYYFIKCVISKLRPGVMFIYKYIFRFVKIIRVKILGLPRINYNQLILFCND